MKLQFFRNLPLQDGFHVPTYIFDEIRAFNEGIKVKLDTPAIYAGNHSKKLFLQIFHGFKAFNTEEVGLNSLLQIPKEVVIIPALYLYRSLSLPVGFFTLAEKDCSHLCRHKGGWIEGLDENGAIKLEDRADVCRAALTEAKLGKNFNLEE